MADGVTKLFWELKTRYPEVPDSVVSNLMNQLGNNRERCIEMLARASPKYLFGGPENNTNQNCRVNDYTPTQQLSDLNFGVHRPRSDSSGSNMSNASSSSASSRQLGATGSNMYNVPGYRGPITTFEDHSQQAGNVMAKEMDQFMTLPGRDFDQNPPMIPSINCNNNGSASAVSGAHGYNNRTQYGGSNLSGHNPGSAAQTVLRPIEVKHIQSRENRESPTPSYTCQIQIKPGPASSMSAQQQHGTPNLGWTYHPVSPASPYHNVLYPSSPENMAQHPELQPLPLTQHQPFSINHGGMGSPYKSPVEDQVGLGNYAQQHYGVPQRSVQTIYLSNPPIHTSNSFSTMPKPVQQSPLSGQYNPGSLNDVRLSPNPNVVRSQSSQSSSGHGPVVVEFKPPKNAGVQSQIQFFNTISGPPNSVGSGRQTPQGVFYAGHNSPQVENPEPAQTRPFHSAERPTVIHSRPSRDGDGFMQFPMMPNECRVPGHASAGPNPLMQKSHSLDSESVFMGEEHLRHPMGPGQQPFLSPASSHSSLSSESSAQRPPPQERPRSGSVDDPAYLQALLSHQKSRMDKLTEDLGVATDRLKHLRNDVTQLQSRVIERKRQKSNVFPSSVDLAKLRGDNLQMQADIQLMTREIDLYNNGTTPLGVLDPLEQQNFYKNMNTGPRGSIYGNAQAPRTTTQALPTSTTATGAGAIATPTRPPPDVPPQLPPRTQLPLPRDPPRDVPPPLPPRISVVHPVAPATVPPAPPAQPAVNSGDSDADGEQWSCSACTFLNHPALNKCECCEMPRMSGGNASTGSGVTSPVVTSPRDIPDSFPSSPATTPTT